MSEIPICAANHKNQFSYKSTYETTQVSPFINLLCSISQKSTQFMLILIFQGMLHFMESEFTKEWDIFYLLYCLWTHNPFLLHQMLTYEVTMLSFLPILALKAFPNSISPGRSNIVFSPAWFHWVSCTCLTKHQSINSSPAHHVFAEMPHPWHALLYLPRIPFSFFLCWQTSNHPSTVIQM